MKTDKEKKQPRFRIIHIFIIILIIAGVSLLGAIVINELYKAGGGYQTEWGASDVLMYFGAVLGAIGTVGLGGLTLWQNEKLREQNERLAESNDDFQMRIEKLTIDANTIAKRANELYIVSNDSLLKSNVLLLKSNEQSIIDKIIEFENKRLDNIAIANEQLQKSCLGIDFAKALFENKNIRSKCADLLQEAGYNYVSLLSEFRKDKEVTEDSLLMKSLYLMYKLDFDYSNTIINEGQAEAISSIDLEKLKNAIKDYRKEYDKYLAHCQERLRKTIFEEKTLEEVRSIFGYSQEEENGQDEDGE